MVEATFEKTPHEPSSCILNWFCEVPNFGEGAGLRAAMGHASSSDVTQTQQPIGSIFTNILVPVVNYLDYEGKTCVRFFP